MSEKWHDIPTVWEDNKSVLKNTRYADFTELWKEAGVE
jgi:hypothetical protein